MANLGYVSTFNVNGNELTIKDTALTEVVNEIIEAIGANNGDISERINNLHERSFDALIKISSQNESEISNVQDGMYKIQYVTVTGEGDNKTETLNNSAILIQKGANQYLYKDGQISSRTKTNSTWGSWITFEGGVTSVNGMTGAVVTTLSSNYATATGTNSDLLLGSGDTYEHAFGKLEKEILDNELITAAGMNDLNDQIANIIHPVSSVNGMTGAVVLNIPVTSVNGMTGAVSITIPDVPVTSVNGMTGAVTISHPVTSTKQSKINYITGSPEPNGTAFGVSTSQYIHFDTGDFNVNINSSNGHLYFNTNEVALKNDIKVSSVNGATGAVTVKANVQSDWNATTGDAVILNKPTIPTVPTTSTTVTENDNNPVSGGAVYAKFEDLIGSAPTALDTLGEIAAALNNDADLAGTLTNQIAGKISKVSPATAGNFASLNSDGTLSDSGHKHSDYLTEAPVTSVNGQTGAVTINVPVTSVNGQTGAININVGVTSFNGSTGAVTYTAPVTSVNGSTGAVTVKANVQSDWNATSGDAVILNKPDLATYANKVTSVNGMTGAVTVNVGVTSFNGSTGAVTYTAPVTSVNGQTGAVTVKANVQSDWNATSGDAVILNKPTIPTVNNSTVTITMNGATVGTFTLNKSGNTTINLGTVLTEHQSIKTINNQTITGSGNVNISGLPTVTSADNGKVLMVVNGAWQLVSPVTLYSGSGTPANSQGNNGDLYVQS